MLGGVVFNNPRAVAEAGDKFSTFQKLDGVVAIPDWTGDRQVAEEWIAEGHVVVCRTKLRGHSGAGIVIAARLEDMVDAPLYTKYIKKLEEYRVHVAFGEVIDVTAKRKRRDFSGEVNYAVRNHDNGWVYCRENIQEPVNMREMALAAVETMGLDFGAVDIIYNRHQGQCYILEINTAPGVEATTVAKYTEAFANKVGNHG